MPKEPIRNTSSEEMQSLINRAGGHAIHPEDLKRPGDAALNPVASEVNTTSDRTTGRGQSSVPGADVSP